MQKSYDPRRYDLTSFDQHLCLKPPLLLWGTVIYLSRAVSLPFVIGIGSLAGGSANTNRLMHGLFDPYTLLPSCVAFLVLAALAVRSPSSGRPVRWIFSHGRLLLLAAAILDAGLGLSSVSLEHLANGDEQAAGALLALALDAYILVYLFVSRRVRDVFSDFPAAEI
jgi:hypothetical protein